MSDEPEYILLEDWARRTLDVVPAIATLCKYAREGRFTPEPNKVGRNYYVSRDATLDAPTTGTLRVAIAGAPTALYRHFDAAGRLLYVGVSVSALHRQIDHSDKAAWFGQVVKITLERFATRAAALAAEGEAIAAEKPLHNIKGAAR